MFRRLAFRNVKANLRDYSIYFMTLLFGVCLFYMFNSIESQTIMMELSDKQFETFQSIGKMMDGLSIFVSFVLAFLLIYANNFFISRRKKEIGLYQLMGMKQRQILSLLTLELLILATFSLGLGILLGVFLSQFMSFITALLVGAKIEEFKFVFSPEAAFSTVFYFAVIYAVVGIFGGGQIAKYKIVDLLNAKSKESAVSRNKKAPIAAGILGILMVIGGIYYLFNMDLLELDKKFMAAFLSGVVGTLLFINSFSQLYLKIRQKHKQKYFFGLKVFEVRQLSAKLKRGWLTIAVTTLVLTLAMSTFSIGLGIARSLNKTVNNYITYDIAYVAYFQHKQKENILEQIEKDTKLSEFSSFSFQVKKYISNIKVDDVIKFKKLNQIKRSEVNYISYEDYKKLAKTQGKKIKQLAKNQYIIISNLEKIETIVEGKDKSEFQNINLEGSLFEYSGEFQNINLSTSMFPDNYFTVVIDENNFNKKDLNVVYVNANFKSEEDQEEYLKREKSIYSDYQKAPYTLMNDRESVKANIYGTNLLLSLLSTYLGFVFLICSSAVLSIQQLSEASDNKERYKILKEIGSDKKDINKSLFNQIRTYFMVPYAIALVYSIVFIKYISDKLSLLAGGSEMPKSMLEVLFVVSLIYVIYFLVTYFNAKKIIDEDL